MRKPLNQMKNRAVLGLLLGGQLLTSLSAHSGASDEDIQMQSVSCAPAVTCSGTPAIRKLTPTLSSRAHYAVKDVMDLSTELVGEPGSWQAKITVKAEGELLVNGTVSELTKMMTLDQSGRNNTPFTFKIGKGDGSGPVRNYSLSCVSRSPAKLPKECLAKAKEPANADWGLSTEGSEALSTR